MAEGDIAYSTNQMARYRQVGGIWVADTPDAQSNPWYNRPEYQSPITYQTGTTGNLIATPWTPPQGPAREAILAARARSGGLITAQTQQQYDALVRGQQEAQRAREEYQNNLILGIIPNPLQKYDKPVSNILEKSPFLIYPRKFAEATYEAYPAENQPDWSRSDLANFIVGIPTGYAEDARLRPTKFVSEIALGFGLGKVFIWGESALTGLAARGTISSKTATELPKAVKYGLGGLYTGGVGYSVIQEPEPIKKGKIVGRAARELTGLGIGAGIASGWRPRLGMTTELVETTKTTKTTKKEPKIIDLRETIDLSKSTIDISTYGKPAISEPITKAERAMLIRQYRMTPEEVALARTQRLSTNNILDLRRRLELPETYIGKEIKFSEPKVLTNERVKTQPAISNARVRVMRGFVPDKFTTPVSELKPGIDTKFIYGGEIIDLTDTSIKPDIKTTTKDDTKIITRLIDLTTTTNITTLINPPATTIYQDYWTYQPTVPKIPELTIPRTPVVPIIPMFPLFPGGGSSYPGAGRWGYVFGEKLSKGDPSLDVFGFMMGKGKRRKAKKKSRKQDFGINFNALTRSKAR